MNADDLHQSFGGKKRYNDFRIIKISSNHSLLLKSESGIVEVEAIPVNELKQIKGLFIKITILILILTLNYLAEDQVVLTKKTSVINLKWKEISAEIFKESRILLLN